MAFAIPDPRFEMPSLLEPGRKPLDPVSIDWSNPLTEGLVGCYIFQHSQPIVNLAKVDAITNLSSGVVHSPEGLDFNNITKVIDLPPPVGLAGSTDWTIMFKGSKPDGIGSIADAFFCIRTNTDTNNTIFVYPWDDILTTGMRVGINGPNSIIQDNNAVQFDGLPHSFTIRNSPGSLVANLDEYEIHNDASSDAVSALITNLSLGGYNTNKQLSVDTYMYHLYIFNKDIGEAATYALHEDPYQIFAQPGPSRIMVETASVSSISYDMYYKTLLSQSVM